MSKVIIVDADIKTADKIHYGFKYDVSNGKVTKDGKELDCWESDVGCDGTVSILVCGPDGNEVPVRVRENFNGCVEAYGEDVAFVQSLYATGTIPLHYYVIENNGEFEYRSDQTRRIHDTASIEWWSNFFIETYYGEGNGELIEECEAEYNNGCVASIEASFITEEEFTFLRKFIS